ncbi:unnamed protein product [Allacma fusca]|uniref:Oxidoreductase N-terminal domain-containing protein n=1 Tax=Allacma fusca TaxID=39272 RepID=A0A8J2PKI3_9HEXA|nr:unnamed protein product [Allacma fusca]
MSKVARIARKFVLQSHPQGKPKLSDFKLVEEKLPAALQEGEILTKAQWLTVDPYMRGALLALKQGETMMGSQVATVTESRNPEYPEGTKVVGSFGWRDLTVHKPSEKFNPLDIYKLPDMKGLPESYALGSVGMPGNTAYFGVTRILEPKAGDVLVVSAAAGAVGSLVGQIGKLKGSRNN